MLFFFFFLKLGDINIILFGQMFNDVFSESILAKLLLTTYQGVYRFINSKIQIYPPNSLGLNGY